MNQLESAINNDRNIGILDETLSKIKCDKNDILQYIGIKGKDLATFHKQLEDYRYIEEVDKIKTGCYARYISLKSSTPDKKYKLTNGGIITNIVINETDKSVLLTLKNNMNRFFSVKFDHVILFQKLTDQERVILHLLKYID